MSAGTANRWVVGVAALAVALWAADAAAQKNQGPPNALQGFSQNRDEPVKIRAASLEVREKDKMATFSGDVHVLQGDTEMRCKSLVVFYEEESGPRPVKAAEPGPGGDQQIRRIEAKGNVVVVQKDQNAAGDAATFNMRENTVTLVGQRGRNPRCATCCAASGWWSISPAAYRGWIRAGSRACFNERRRRRSEQTERAPEPVPPLAGKRYSALRHRTIQVNPGGFRGRGVLDILALFRHRRPPRRPPKTGNGRWQDVNPGSSGEAMPSARSKAAPKPAAAKPRPRRQEPAARRDAPQGYLAAHSLEKSYGGRRVVNGVSLYVRRGEAVGLLGTERRRQDHRVLHDHRPDQGRPRPASSSTATTSPICRCTSGRGSASAICRRKRRSFAASTSRTISARCSKWSSRTGAGARPISTPCSTSSRSRVSQDAVDRAVGRRAAPGRDRPRAGESAELHAARRAVRRHRSQGRGRHPAVGAAPDHPRHRRAHHRPQCARDPRPHRPRPTSSIPARS